MEQLKKTKAKIIALHGTLDESTPIESFDILRSELLTTGANATFVKIEGADHAFNIPGEQAPEGMRRALQRVWQWYEESGSH